MCLPRRVQIRSAQGDAQDPNYSKDTTNTQSGNFQRHRGRFSSSQMGRCSCS